MAKRKSGKITKKQLGELKAHLDDERNRLLGLANNTKRAEMDREKDASGDEVDEASQEITLRFERRLRDREQGKLRKIDKALGRIEDGEYDECESCGEPIGFARLKARPVASLCIQCKTKQEAQERQYAES